MERWPWIAAPMSAVMPRLDGRLTLAPRFSSSLTISRWSLAAAMCSRVAVASRPSVVGAEPNASAGPPVPSHLTTLCNSPLSADTKIWTGSEAGGLVLRGEATTGGGAACCRMSSAVAVWT